MKYPTIRIEGAILSPETLDKIGAADSTVQGQRPLDFRLDATAKVKDEIAATWADAQDHWRIFRRKTKDLKATDTGTSEVRKFWMVPFLSLLGYDLEPANAELVNGQSYAISHRDKALGGFPVHLTGYQDWQHKAPEERTTLDIKPSNAARRMSPHALVQEYINLKDEHSYAIISNGLQLRLLRDSSRLTRLSFIEWNLEQMMDEEVYADFALLYRLLHASRMPATGADTAQSLIEGYHQDALEGGSRIREGLSGAVKKCIEGFANGFLQHRDNDALREALKDGGPDASKEYFGQQLRLIYRLLFLMVTEERDLIYAKGADKSQRNIYYKYYSLQRLRRLAEKAYLRDARYTDHWAGLQQIFSLFEAPLSAHAKGRGEALGIQPLGGDLFSQGALGLMRDCTLSNKVLLECLYDLSVFRHKDTGARIRVNYASLNVEEFGSVYEGLLEYDAVVQWNEGAQPQFRLVKGSERSSSGSHYTPDELVQPLIKHSLEYLIEERLKEPDPVEALLRLKVCDVACGSGHILLSAARRIAVEVARKKWNEEQPSPAHLREATREVIKRCIYGVDKNPLAVELCKVALWLEAHNPGEPLGFLDHHIKCGDAIVGLAHRAELERGIADEAFKALPGDDKAVASAWKKQNAHERKAKTQLGLFEESINTEVEQVLARFKIVDALPSKSVADEQNKAKAYKQYEQDIHLIRLRQLADVQVGQFFLEKTAANRESLLTDAEYRGLLRQVHKGLGPLQSSKIAIAQERAAKPRQFFHWFLEFPDVFDEGGFDCILGNPPYLGDRKLKDFLKEDFLEWIRYNYTDGATVDLVVYFFLRIHSLLRNGGFLSLISTNTIAQGKARENGLEKIIVSNSIINHAVKGMKWPGLAAVEVSLITILKGGDNWKGKIVLNGKETSAISGFLDDSGNDSTPKPLPENDGKSFQGSIVLGLGFVLSKEQAYSLIQQNAKNREVIQPYLNGDDLNSNPDQSPNRFVINFSGWPLDKCREFQEPFSVIDELVRPERQRWKQDDNGKEIEGTYALRSPLPERWWQHAEKRPALYAGTRAMNRVMVSCRVSKYVNQSMIPTGPIFDVATSVVLRDKWWEYALLQNSIHDVWAWKYASTLESRIRYVNVDCIDTFPFPRNLSPEQEQTLESIGERYHEHRRQLMLATQLGLTKTYNLFHSRELRAITPAEDALEDKAFAKALGKDAARLRRHLRATPGTIPFNEAVQRIEALRALHVEMDAAVLSAYGWQDLPLRPDFYEVDYLPEGDRIRYTIHPDARKEVLKRLLELNHQIHAEEMAVAETNKLLAVKSPKKTKEPKSAPQLSLLPNPDEPVLPYTTPIFSIKDAARYLLIDESKARRWFNMLREAQYEGIGLDKVSGQLMVSFHGLTEMSIIGSLREIKIPFPRIFTARKSLAELTQKQYPFATNNVRENMRLREKELYYGLEHNQVNISRGNQMALEFVGEFLEQIRYKNDLANALFPKRGKVNDVERIIISPEEYLAVPTLVHCKRPVADVVAEFRASNNSYEHVLREFGANEEDITAGLQFMPN